MFVVKSRLLGHFLDAKPSLRQQISGAHQAQFQQILVGTGAGVLLESVPDEL